MIVTVDQESIPPRVVIQTTEDAVYRTIGTDTIRVRGVAVEGVIYDHELPQAAEATYTDGLETSGVVVMPDVGVWLVHLGNPDLSVRVDIATHPSWGRPAQRSVLEIPEGGAIAVSFARAKARGTFSVNVYDEARMAALLADGSTLFLSTPPYAGLGPAYVSIGDAGWNRVAPHWYETERLLDLPYIEVNRPTFVPSSTVTIGSLNGTIGSLVGTIADLGG